MELSWETPSARALELISHYQLFLNKVTYRRSISPYAGRLLIKDLAGGKYYETILMVYPKGQHLVPQQSNIIVNLSFEIFALNFYFEYLLTFKDY